MKKGWASLFLGVFLVVCFSIGFLGTERLAAAEKKTEGKITIRLSHSNNITYIRHKSALKWKEVLEKESNGQVEVKIYPASQLYKSNEEMSALLMGNIDMVAFGGGGQIGTIVPEWEIFNMPFFWPNDGKDFLSAVRFKNSEIVKKLMVSKLERKGLKHLGFFNGSAGPSSMTTTKQPIRAISDMKGLKINTIGGWQRREVAKILGFSMVTIPKSEVGQALSQGTIDGEISTPADALTSGYPVKYLHQWPSFSSDLGSSFVMSGKVWNGLPANIQKIIETLATPEAQKYTLRQVLVDEMAAAETLKKRGVVFVDLNPGELEEIIRRLSYVPDMFAEKFGQDGKELIRVAREMIAEDIAEDKKAK